MYKHGQNGDDSRGLITRTLSYYEFITFCLKANPYSKYSPHQDKNKYVSKINKFLKNIPVLEPDSIEQLCLPEGFYDKLYAFMIDYCLSFDEMVLFNVYEICRIKNPKNTSRYDVNYFKHEQPTWLHPPTRNITYSETEKELIKINRIQTRLNYALQRQEDLYKLYGKEYVGSRVEENLKQLSQEMKTLKEHIGNGGEYG